MSKNRTFARPYAKAAFEMAQSENAFANWSEMLALAAMIATDKQFHTLAKDPRFSTQELVALFDHIGKDTFTNEMKSFIRILGRFKRLGLLPEIAVVYEEMRAHAERVVNVELISAQPLNEQDQERFVQVLKKRMHCDISLACQVDKSILGGAIIRAGDLVIDGSIRGRLAKLGDAVGIS